LRETDHLEDLSVVRSKILKWMLNKSIGRAWKNFFLGQNTVTNLGSSTKVRNSLTTHEILASQEGLCSMDLVT